MPDRSEAEGKWCPLPVLVSSIHEAMCVSDAHMRQGPVPMQVTNLEIDLAVFVRLPEAPESGVMRSSGAGDSTVYVMLPAPPEQTESGSAVEPVMRSAAAQAAPTDSGQLSRIKFNLRPSIAAFDGV